MGRDASKDSGDHAAWQDLVARFELPTAIDPANAPWPDRENLVSSAHSSNSSSAADSTSVGPNRPAAPIAPTAPDTGQVQQANDATVPGPGNERPANRGRVVRPASFLQWGEPGDGRPPHQGTDISPGGDDDSPPWPASGRDPELPSSDGRFDEQTRSSGPDLGLVDFDIPDDDDEDERYVPPHLPPQPKLDPVAKGAWTALFGGPGYLFLATTLGWQVPGWAELAAIVAFISGFVILVSRLGDGPSRRDGPDQGAVV